MFKWGIVAMLIFLGLYASGRLLNESSTDSLMQSGKKMVYSILARLNRKKAVRLSHPPVQPPASFYSLKGVLNDGVDFSFASLKGKYVLLVNTASGCGYTPQYTELQELHEKYGKQVEVIGFPSGDFRNQEKATDAEIRQFCKKNYGVSFLLMQKSHVLPGVQQHSVYQWLTDPAKNGWNKKAPSWNFGKYLIDKEGRLLQYFDPAVSPLDEAILKTIKG